MLKKSQAFTNDRIGTFVGPQTRFVGDLHTQESVRVEGTIEGNIHAQGDVHIGEGSHVNGNIHAQHANVSGEVTGDIHVTHGLHIAAKGRVFGDIRGDKLIIDEGAIYQGKVNMDVIQSENIYEGRFQLATNQTA